MKHVAIITPAPAAATEAIDYSMIVGMLLDGLFVDGAIASRRRVYSAEDIVTVERWHAAQYSKDNIKYDVLEPFGAEALSFEERHNSLWPFFTAGIGRNPLDLKVRPLTVEEGLAGFSTMTALVRVLERNKGYKKLYDARTSTGRAYQLAELLLRGYRFGGWNVHPAYLYAARIVYQTVNVELQLRDIGNDIRQLSALANGKSIRSIPPTLHVVPFMLAPGRSSYDAEAKFDKDASTLRERLVMALGAIEKKYGSYCNELPIPPQTAKRSWYNIDIKCSALACRTKQPRSSKFKQPFSLESKVELAVMQVLSWAHGHYRKRAGLEPRQLPTGYAQHYPEYPGDRACGDKQYPDGVGPLIIYLPQPEHDFGNEMPTTLPPVLGLPWNNNYHRWSGPWLNQGVVYRKVPERFPIRLRGEWRDYEDIEAPNAGSGDDLVNKLAAHSERGDDRISRVHDAYELEDEDPFDEEVPLFSRDVYQRNPKHEE